MAYTRVIIPPHVAIAGRVKHLGAGSLLSPVCLLRISSMYVRHLDTSTRGVVGSVVFDATNMNKTSMIIKYTYLAHNLGIFVTAYHLNRIF